MNSPKRLLESSEQSPEQLKDALVAARPKGPPKGAQARVLKRLARTIEEIDQSELPSEDMDFTGTNNKK